MPLIDIDIDLVARTITVEGGSAGPIALPDDVFAGAQLTRIKSRLTRGELELEFSGGDAPVIVELRTGSAVAEIRAGRPAVYLDQNKWRIVTDYLHGRRVPPLEAKAAETIVNLVSERKLLLPASGGHLVEAGPMYGRLGFEVASTILGQSRGWQMRSPLRVREAELLAAVSRGTAASPPAVISPDAGPFATYRPPFQSTGDLPKEAARFTPEVTSALSLWEALIDPEPVPAAKEKAAFWAGNQQALADQLAADNASAKTARGVVTGRLLLDMFDSVGAASLLVGRVPLETFEYFAGPDDPIRSAPYLSRMRDVLYFRTRNAQQRWEANDLIDINFLCCAAGYVDVVVAEKNAIGYLRQVRSVTPGALFATSLSEAVECLKQLGHL